MPVGHRRKERQRDRRKELKGGRWRHEAGVAGQPSVLPILSAQYDEWRLLLAVSVCNSTLPWCCRLFESVARSCMVQKVSAAREGEAWPQVLHTYCSSQDTWPHASHPVQAAVEALYFRMQDLRLYGIGLCWCWLLVLQIGPKSHCDLRCLAESYLT